MRIKRGIYHFKKLIKVAGFAAVAGEMEEQGPLKNKFDKIFRGSMFGEKSYEKAESKMQVYSVKKAMEKAKTKPDEIDAIFAGDLLNQCIGSNYGLRELEIPFIGVYGACSTMAESILVACMFLETGNLKKTVSVTSSHFCAAERQFRFPLEYGGQRPLSSQWTATASGAVVLKGDEVEIFDENAIYVKSCCVGKIIDFGVKDINNMGAAMSPAAKDTLLRFFRETKTTEKDYDLILTGDLGEVGSKMLKKLLQEEGVMLKEKHKDCGLLLYDNKKQDVHAGGSGPGCSAAVLCADVLSRMQKKEIKNLIFIATGALMSTTANQQGETIPSIAHLVFFKANWFMN